MQKLKLSTTMLGLFGALLLMAGCQTGDLTADRGLPTTSANGPARLTDVSVFSNGVGVFEYQGVVDNNAAQTLTFRGDQINDVLGSMVFQDAGGGRVGEITFPTATPLSVVLHGFRVNLDGLPSRSDILSQLRGVMVTVTLKQPAMARVTGRIIDVRATHGVGVVKQSPLVVRTDESESSLQKTEWTMNLLCGGAIRQIKVGDIAAVHIRSAAVRRSLNQALDALANQPDRSTHPVTVWFRGHGRRQVGFAYLAEAPVWRMTYRIIEPPADVGASTAKKLPTAMPATATLQAMAIVANQSSTDWTNVRLDIRGGDPVSFLTDLYQALYSRRTVQPLPTGALLTPQTYGHAAAGFGRATIVSKQQYEQLNGLAVRRSANNGGGGGMFGGGGGPQPYDIYMARERISTSWPTAASGVPFNPLQGVEAVASAGKGHPAFDYHVENISVARGQSVMAPVLVTSVATRPTDFCSAAELFANPSSWQYAFMAVDLKNTAGKFLPSGPVAVYQGPVFAGQATLPALRPGQHHLVRFALDRALRVKLAHLKNDPSQLVRVGIKGGVLNLHFTIDTHYEFVTFNAAGSPKTLLLKMYIPLSKLISSSSAKLANPRHRKSWRFRLSVPAVGGKTLSLLGRSGAVTTEILSGMDNHALSGLVKQYPQMPPAIFAAIRRGEALNTAVMTAAKATAATNAQIATINTITTHLGQSLATLKKATPAYNDMATQLGQQNKLFVQASNQLAKENSQLAAAQSVAVRYWSNLSVPAKAVQPHH